MLPLLIVAVAVFLYLFLYPGFDIEQPAAKGEAGGLGAAGVCFIDVGQGDSIFITNGEAVVLIDTGEEEYVENVLQQLNIRGITRIDALIGTHPHSDHIGGLDIIIESYEIGALYMPKVINNTRQFEQVITAASAKGLRLTAPSPGDMLELPGGLILYFLGPMLEDDSNINNSSIIVKAEFSNKEAAPGARGFSVLLAADAESLAERLLLESGADLSADVLKIGHHGSATSTKADFLSAVNPMYAVIQCGAGNPYGHPDAGVLGLLVERDVTILRNDISGSITFSHGQDAPGGYKIITERGNDNE